MRQCRCILVVGVVVALAALVSAQITFSRDWTGGKRAAPQQLDCGQFARLCRHFLHELKAAMGAELGDKRRRSEGQALYDDD